MASEKTSNIGLNKWTPSDYVKVDEFNDNFDKIDEVVADHAAQLAQKAKELDLEVERERINNLVANAGDVSNNAELLDIRVGANGKTYSTAGEMVRDIRRDLEELGVIGLNIYDKNNVHLDQYPPNDATVINGDYSSLLTLVGRTTTKPIDMGSDGYHSFVTKNITGLTMFNSSGARVGYISGTAIADGYMLFHYTTTPYQYCGFRLDTANVDTVEIYVGDTVPNEQYRFKGKKILSDVSLKDNADFQTLLESDNDKININFYMPTQVNFLNGIKAKRRVPLFNLITGYNKRQYRINRYGNYNRMYDHFIISGTADTNGYNNLIKRTDDKNSTIESITTLFKCVNPTTKQNPSTQNNVLMIGDSFTDVGYLPAFVKRKLTIDYGFTNFNFVGSRTSTKEGITTNHEGHAGYTVTDFIKLDNTEGRGTVSPNPFLFNGSLSISTLLANNGFSGTVDTVIIELGVNDILSEKNTDDLIEDMTALINQVRTEYPNSYIYLVGLVMVSEINDFLTVEHHNGKVQNVNKAYEELASSLTNTEYVDVNTLFDVDNAYPYEMQPVYEDSNETIKIQTDYLHPSRVGYNMESECIVASIVNNLSDIV